MTAAVVWITGLPSSGKSTFARALADDLGHAGVPCCILDGDDVRRAVAPTLGYTAGERDAFYETLARLAALIAGQGLVVLVAATAHLRRYRARARELAPSFFEVWMDTPVDECRRRDSKGLYAFAESGQESHVPGAGVDYEVPLAPDLVVRDGHDREVIAAARRLVAGESTTEETRR
jgi:adenylylsulfate kinase